MASPDPTAVTAALNATRALNLAREANDAAVGITRARGVASGYAPLDGSGLVPASYLPTSSGGLSQPEIMARQAFGGF